MSDKSNRWRNKEGSHKNTLSHMTKHVLVQTYTCNNIPVAEVLGLCDCQTF